MELFEGLEEDVNKKILCKFNVEKQRCDKLKEQNITKQAENKLDKKETNSENLNSVLFECNDDFKNRFYYENLTDDEFFDISGAKKTFFSFYKKILKSGVGSVILGGIYLGLNQKQNINFARISLDESVMEEYKKITKLAHSNKCKMFLKIKSPYGRFNPLYLNSQDLKIASNYGLEQTNKQRLLIRISDNKCNEMIADFAKSVMLAEIAGFDGIVLDATLNNVIGELSSQEFNKRIFGYFSDTDDFIKKTLKNIDVKNKEIILKLSVLSFFSVNKENANLVKISQNFNEKKLISDIKEYIKLGVDGFEFEFGIMNNEFLNCFNSFEDELLFEKFIKNFHLFLKENNITNKFGKQIKIFYHDNFKNMKIIEEMIKSEQIDFVDISKNLLSNQNYIQNLLFSKNGLKCIKCSYCNKKAQFNRKMECLINPELKNEIKTNTDNSSKIVAVVGSGISGLVCALTLAKRGFKVQIYEQENELNKNGKLSTVFGFDKALLEYFEDIEEQIKEYQKSNRIEIFKGQKFVYDKTLASKFYSIIVATGYKENFLAVNGAVLPHIHNIFEVLGNESILKNRGEIVIYAKTLLSIKLALFLSFTKNITLIIKDFKELKKEKNANLFYFFWNLYKNNVKFHFLSRISKINEDNIDIIINKNYEPGNLQNLLKITNSDNNKISPMQINIDCDLLIYEPELSPNNSLYVDIVKNHFPGEVYLIGNALENSDLAETIKSGYFVGKNL